MTKRLMLSAVVIAAVALAELAAQELHFTGGAVEGTQVRTNIAAALYDNQDPGTAPADYLRLPSSNLTVHLEPGDSDLFVYEIDAECRLGGAGLGDYVDVQARVNGLLTPPLGGSARLQPQDVPSQLALCSTTERRSVAKSWAIRLSGGSEGADYTFTIFWRATDVGVDNHLIARLDNRTVRVTRYN